MAPHNFTVSPKEAWDHCLWYFLTSHVLTRFSLFSSVLFSQFEAQQSRKYFFVHQKLAKNLSKSAFTNNNKNIIWQKLTKLITQDWENFVRSPDAHAALDWDQLTSKQKQIWWKKVHQILCYMWLLWFNWFNKGFWKRFTCTCLRSLKIIKEIRELDRRKRKRNPKTTSRKSSAETDWSKPWIKYINQR